MHLLKVNRRHFTGTFGCPKSTSLGYGVRLVYIGKGPYCNIGKDDHTNIILLTNSLKITSKLPQDYLIIVMLYNDTTAIHQCTPTGHKCRSHLAAGFISFCHRTEEE